MATLIIENGQTRRAGSVEGPLLIGRRPANAIIVDDPEISHVHAWIGKKNGSYFVSHIASRGQTLVNGELVLGRRQLKDGDTIQIGKTTRLTYVENGAFPVGLEWVDLCWRGPLVENPDVPVVFNCQCGASMSITPVFSGSVAKCPICERMVMVPYPSPNEKRPEAWAAASEQEPETQRENEMPEQRGRIVLAASSGAIARAIELPPATKPRREEPPLHEPIHTLHIPAVPAPKATTVQPKRQHTLPRCGVCHTDIETTEAKHECPGCNVMFHHDCWIANYGCSSYGCEHVDSLKPKEAPTKPVKLMDEPVEDPFPWEFAMLGASVLSLVLSVLAFGIPSTLSMGATGYVMRRGAKRRGILAAAGAVALVGIVLGVEISAFWWLGRPLHWIVR